MKVLMINGSPHANGATVRALKEMETTFAQQGVETEIVQIGTEVVRGCVGCAKCRELGRCVFDDVVNELAEKFKEADGLVVASPVYYASANGTLTACLDRLFYSSSFDKTMKVGASLAVARRGGITATFDQLNKYFAIVGMPIASGQYWNGFHDWNGPQDQAHLHEDEDAEGLQQMRTLARNMSFLMKAIADAKDKYGLPEKESPARTNFVR